jgi:hypothetical protein
MKRDLGRRAGAFVLVSALFPIASLFAAEEGASTPAPGSSIRLLLPKTIYAVPGVETNVYFDNICLVVNPRNYVFDVTCSKGTQQAERWSFNPTHEDVGEHELAVEVFDRTNRVLARAESSVRVVPPDAGASRTVSLLCIGDSLTANGVYPGHVASLCAQPGNPRLSLTGSNRRGGSAHEGYGGWTAHRFATLYSDKDFAVRGSRKRRARSPFVYAGAEGPPKRTGSFRRTRRRRRPWRCAGKGR